MRFGIVDCIPEVLTVLLTPINPYVHNAIWCIRIRRRERRAEERRQKAEEAAAEVEETIEELGENETTVEAVSCPPEERAAETINHIEAANTIPLPPLDVFFPLLLCDLKQYLQDIYLKQNLHHHFTFIKKTFWMCFAQIQTI